ncbi:hypothetical protein [Streptomyces sp. NPDC093094]|uniref:hypothetical protein n=1 Tax=Streptomyces sp. NPDC093094 TaxID=3366026 RepID=UPI0037F72B02
MSRGTSPQPGRPPRRTIVWGVCAAVTAVLTVTSCSSDDDGGSTATPTRSAPVTSNFSGEAPSALASLAESKKARASASASAAASSASVRASEFEASVSADIERSRAEAQKQLSKVEGRGNAIGDVSLTGLPLNETNNVRAFLVTITNRTDDTASYAVQVDLSDSDGKVAETVFVGAQDLGPGKRVQRFAISRKPPQPPLTAKIAKAQRY